MEGGLSATRPEAGLEAGNGGEESAQTVSVNPVAFLNGLAVQAANLREPDAVGVIRFKNHADMVDAVVGKVGRQPEVEHSRALGEHLRSGYGDKLVAAELVQDLFCVAHVINIP